MNPDRTTDDRIIRESGIDARIALIVGPVLRDSGYRLVRVRVSGQNGLTLQIMAEREDGTMTVEDCEEASRVLSPVLDVEDPLDKAYNLEISSPGIDRPLVRLADFEAALGHLAKLETDVPVAGRKRFRGRIEAVTPTAVSLRREAGEREEESTVELPFEALAEARLVLTDDLIRDALARDNRERKARRRNTDTVSGDAGDTH